MNGALIFLVTRSFANAVMFRLKRLRQPKYLAGAVMGGLYFYFYFFRFLFHGGRPHSDGPTMPIGDLGVEIGALILFGVVVVFSWLWASSRASLHFTEAEIAWLFPAPLDRPALIRYKLLKSQLGLLFLSLVMTLISGRAAQGSVAWMHMAGWWIVFSTLQLHRLGASFALQRLTQCGLADGKRRLAVVIGVLALAALIYFWKIAMPQPPSLTDKPRADDWIAWAREFLNAGPAPWLLLPFRVVVQPWFATDFTGFLRALPGALLLLALHYIWVVRAHVSFEEASIVVSQKRAAFIAARRGGDMRVTQAPRTANEPPFRLRPTGFAPSAFFWKHSLSTGGRRSLRRWLGFGVILFTIACALSATGRWPLAHVVVAIVAAAVFGLVTLTNSANGSQVVRRDLMAIDLLKTFPLPGWKIVLGELLGPVIGGTTLQVFSLAIIVASLSSLPEIEAAERSLLPIAACAIALLAPAINLTLMIIPTAATLLFPAWFKSGEAVTPGLEMMGIRLIMVLGQFLALLLALIPAAILGAAAWMAAQMLGPAVWAPLAGAFAAAITLGVEAGLGVVWLGGIFDRYDPSSAA